MPNLKIILLILTSLVCGLAASSQNSVREKPKSGKENSEFRLSLSTYNHAELLGTGTMIYSLLGEKLSIKKESVPADDKIYLLDSVKIEHGILEQIENLNLDTLGSYYFNRCVMITSGSEYIISISKGRFTKEIWLHHYYHPQIEKLVTIINKLLSDKYKIAYVSSDTKQDCP